MKKIFRTVTAVCLSAVFVFAALPQSAYAAPAAEPPKKLTVTKTKAIANSVYNADGYGSLMSDKVIDESDGSFRVESTFALMDPSGKIIFPYKTFSGVFLVSDGLFVNVVEHTKKYSLFDLNGDQVIKESYDYMEYENGYALAINYGEGQYLIDRTGKKLLTLPEIFGKVLFTYKGDQGNDFEYIMPKYKYYASIGGFSEGLMWFSSAYPIEKNIKELEGLDLTAFQELDTLWIPTYDVFMTLDGEVVIEQGSDEPFQEGLAPVYNSGYGYIDKEGNTVIDFIYSDAYNFSNGYAAVSKDGKWGCIDKNGNTVVPFIYDGALGGEDGFFVVKLKVGYEEYVFDENDKRIYSSHHYGVVDINGNTVIPITYDQITRFINGTAYAMNDSDIFVLKIEDAE